MLVIPALEQWFSTRGTRAPSCTWKQLTSVNQRNLWYLEAALILSLTKIRPRTEVLACQKQAQLSH
jgi:hypothetical protein